VYPSARRQSAVAAEKKIGKSTINYGGAAKRKGGDAASDGTEPPKKKRPPTMALLSPAMQTFLGTTDEQMVRGDAVKAVYKYVKDHKLQDPSDGRIIVCDSALEAVVKVAKVTYFKLNAKLAPHLKNPKFV
jgi:upstream activation factor subunit UAF30